MSTLEFKSWVREQYTPFIAMNGLDVIYRNIGIVEILENAEIDFAVLKELAIEKERGLQLFAVIEQALPRVCIG